MECRHALSLLEAYLDQELDRAEARELEAHVDGCAGCRAALTRLDALRAALRNDSLRWRAPQRLRERIAAQAQAGEAAAVPTPARRARRAAGWRMAAACVLAFAAGGVTVGLLQPATSIDSDRALLAHDLFASHWRALAAATPVDVVSSDRHTVKPWFAGKVAQAPLVRDFADQGFALVGGRIDYAGSQRVPVLVYRHGQHLIDVFVLADAGALQPAQRSGYTLHPAAVGRQPAAVVSDMDAQELGRFEQLLEQGD
jgi:anti-sigma factor RsiW